MLQEFKDFAVKGNVMDLAVAVVIAAAFGKIISALVDNIIMPLVGMILGGVNFSDLSVTVGEAVVGYGSFIQAIVDFTIVAFVIFMIVRAINKIKAKEEKEKGPSELDILKEIRDNLKK